MRSRIVFSFSLLLLAWMLCVGADYIRLKAEFASASSTESKLKVLLQAKNDVDPQLRKEIEHARPQSSGQPNNFARISEMIALRARVQAAATASPAEDASTAAKRVKSNPLFRDSGNASSSNWLTKAMENIAGLFQRKDRSPEKQIQAGPPPNLRWVLYAVCGILAAIILAFLAMILRHVSWKRSLRRKAAVLDEDEPERTVDEWLARANELIAAQRYREAVQCLYLAMLLRLDEYGVARFIRSETNWEHLARIQASPKRPPSFDFLAPTQAFDRIWYGRRVKGMEDVNEFKSWYADTTSALAAGSK